jgi:predicted small secreted protein
MLNRLLATLLTVLTLVGAAATITGCNTMAGVGQDVQQAGGAIKGEANEHR